MDVQFSAEQRALRDAAAKLAAELAGRWHRGRGPADVDPPVPDPAAWALVVDAGWLAMGLREEHGGAGASAVDLGVVAEQLGYHAVPAPVLGTMIAAAQLETSGAPAAVLEDVAAGTLRVAPALDPDLRSLAGDTDRGDALAWDAAGAQAALLPHTGRLYALGAPVPYADLTRAVRPLGKPRPESFEPRIPDADTGDRLTALALSLLVADLLGTMRAALDAALAHARARRQFGTLIGAFQAVQQLLADAHVLVESSRTAAYRAWWAVDALPGAEALRVARVAKAYASRSAVTVCETAVQVFGGIGMTWESPAHVWLRRAHADRLVLGSERQHHAVLAGGFAPAGNASGTV
ncbi:acyl-CoA dehydrogenase family protein [Phytohabitans kaempferiae]|uniref:Acyl-CoA dehydrogenase family protein n=1 Tax=Phytohabitans kaempferiae TaxID=1620943 RepID=A0ABV6LYA5_9ACTN